MKIIYVVLFIACGLALSCQAQTRDADKETKPISKISTFQPSFKKDDPYFVGTQATESSSGPETITRNMIQDRNGYYWFATWDGIVGYDGETFTNYTNKENLRRFRVFTILEDRTGVIWFGTIGAGIFRYDGKKFQNITMDDGLVDNRVADIYEDHDGLLWFSTLNGISKYDRIAFTNFMPNEGASNNDVNSITQDEYGLYYVGTRGEAFTFDGDEFKTLVHPEGGSFYNVRRMIKDAMGNIWFGGNDGLWRYDGSGYERISEKFTGHIYEDSERNIWTSSVGASPQEWVLSKHRKGDPEQVEMLKEESGMYFGIVEDRDGNMLLGTLGGVYFYGGENFRKL